MLPSVARATGREDTEQWACSPTKMAAEQQIRQLAAQVQQLTEGLQKVQQRVDSQPTGTVLANAVAIAATTAAKETVRQMQEKRREMNNEDEIPAS